MLQVDKWMKRLMMPLGGACSELSEQRPCRCATYHHSRPDGRWRFHSPHLVGKAAYGHTQRSQHIRALRETLLMHLKSGCEVTRSPLGGIYNLAEDKAYQNSLSDAQIWPVHSKVRSRQCQM